MAPSSAFVAGPALPLRRAPGVSATSVAPRRAAGVAAPRMMADKKDGLFGVKMPSMPFGGNKKKAADKAETAAKKTKVAVNQFQANAATAAKKTAEAPKKAAAVPKKAVEEAFMALQPGDAGYVEPKAKSAAVQAVSSAKSAASDVGSAAKSAAKDAGAAVKAATPSNVKKAAGKAVDAVEDAVDDAVEAAKKPAKRGAALLKEDFLRSAPERIGVGRQDQTAVAPPTYGEPGYVLCWRRGLNLGAWVEWGSGVEGWGRSGWVDGGELCLGYRGEAEIPRSWWGAWRVNAMPDRLPKWCPDKPATRHHVRVQVSPHMGFCWLATCTRTLFGAIYVCSRAWTPRSCPGYRSRLLPAF
ncbi:hypothetical protein I4F81_003663 [Pyropia yezoensis]|uniref:Uncharacterized protein n=1 Tax=Pyropia yezoensis TaxID=2788 RepID=A0ACC3BST7_PYRYE|nr:hypothetical protein I4F81_003663 [Neopyropia yezoensis]